MLRYASSFGHSVAKAMECQSGSRIGFARSETAFQTNRKFERIPCLAHQLDACSVIDATDVIRRKNE